MKVEEQADKALRLTFGERLPDGGKVTALDIESIPKARAVLVDAAKNRQRLTYGELRRWADLPHAPHGLGHLLGVLSVHCARRGEPSLASLVVNGATFEVGDKFLGDPEAEREQVYAHWKGWA